VADRLRVLKGLRSDYPDRALYTILDDRLPPELDHFEVYLAPFDPRFLRLKDRLPPETSRAPLHATIQTEEDSFLQVDVIGIGITSLDNGQSRNFEAPVPVESRVVNGVIKRSELFEITLVSQKQQPSQFFAELAFVDPQMRIPSASGFTAARSLEIAPEDLEIGSFIRNRITLKIPGYIPVGLYTLSISMNAVTTEAGTCRGRPLKRMAGVEARNGWAGQDIYQPLATVWVE